MNATLQTPAMADAAHKMKEGAVELKSAVFDRAAELKNEAIEKGSQTLNKACQETEATIRAYPYRSVLVAFGVGALVGMYLFRR